MINWKIKLFHQIQCILLILYTICKACYGELLHCTATFFLRVHTTAVGRPLQMLSVALKYRGQRKTVALTMNIQG